MQKSRFLAPSILRMAQPAATDGGPTTAITVHEPNRRSRSEIQLGNSNGATRHTHAHTATLPSHDSVSDHC